MIHIKRTQTPAVLDMDDEGSMGRREYDRWRKYYEDIKNGTPSKKPGDFKAYADQSVKLTLIKMCHRKCAYCDNSIPVGDVEHWRPKSAVSSEDRKKLSDGYWWLAARWENLLYSCPACNQRRSRELEDQPGLSMAGKGTQFPLADERKRANDVGKEVNETPLLLNPCLDNPEEYFKVGLAGKEKGVFKARLNTANQPDQRAATSIKIYGLNERTHVDRRIKLLRFLGNRMKDLDELFAGFPKDHSTPEAEETLAKIDRILTELKPYLNDDQEDMLLIRQVLVPYLKGLGLEVD